ncbi:LysR family transcriptional regulator [Streptomyces griseolus]|uniref:LysR family transcriptional regulator n=1 Tax=Streptomyces griseolus TaxID=1909 RepID=UPI0022431722|nr:LysR family transcriptional regulator [Streptomyces griseolus]
MTSFDSGLKDPGAARGDAGERDLSDAEEPHFSRTAERLGVSPGRVSQSVEKRERRTGAPLFVRTTRTVRLSPLGEQLYQALKSGHRQITQGIEAARAAARGATGTLTLGTMGPVLPADQGHARPVPGPPPPRPSPAPRDPARVTPGPAHVG